jgi:hypothetical protein|tara:strand:- start:659 stop:1228 length:570 start_codon:yes stop_codon:yes gene_type:complete
MKLTKITSENTFKVHPVKKNCIFEEGKWWYVGCSDGHRRTLESQIRKNKNRMFVGGKYVAKSHPLHKPGTYKDFSSVAFSSMEGYESSTEGYVYVISNPAWKGWYKVGMAVDAWDRCASFQTSSPFRDYKLEYCKHFKDRRSAETETHNLLLSLEIPRKGEWFKSTAEQLKQKIQSIKGERHESIDIST